MKTMLCILSFFILIGAKISANEISWDTLVPNQSIVLKDRFHQHGWMPFAEKSGLLKDLTSKDSMSLRLVLAAVKNSIEKYNQLAPEYYSDPKCTGIDESALLYTIFYPYMSVRQFIFKQDPYRFDKILDKDEKR